MNPNTLLVRMLGQLLKEMELVQSQGAGYYTCSPFAKRFNRLLEQARAIAGDVAGMMSTFETLEESDPRDPADKSKRLLEIHIEIGQLISLLEALGTETQS